MIDQFTLDVVHPCYNPHEGWEKELVLYFNKFKNGIAENIKINVFLVNDGSTMKISNEILEYLHTEIQNFNYVSYDQNRGKGYALRTAITQTQGDAIIYTDADYPYRLENAWEMLGLLKDQNFDAVLGVRDNHYYSQLTFIRKCLSLSLRGMSKIFFPKIFVRDTQSGLKGFNKKGKEVFLSTQTDSFLFDLEFVMLLSKNTNLKLAKIFVHVRDGIVFSEMKTKTIKKELKSFISIYKSSLS